LSLYVSFSSLVSFLPSPFHVCVGIYLICFFTSLSVPFLLSYLSFFRSFHS
jgi:hypothetical protein